MGYKDHFWKLFLDAYKNNYFSASSDRRLPGDAIKDTLTAREWVGGKKAKKWGMK